VALFANCFLVQQFVIERQGVGIWLAHRMPSSLYNYRREILLKCRGMPVQQDQVHPILTPDRPSINNIFFWSALNVTTLYDLMASALLLPLIRFVSIVDQS
jgi:hypothetical protein